MQAIRGAALPAQAPPVQTAVRAAGKPASGMRLGAGLPAAPDTPAAAGSQAHAGASGVGSCGPGLPAAGGTGADAAARSPGAVPWAARGGRPGSGAGGGGGGAGAPRARREPQARRGGAGTWDRSEDWEPGTFRGSARGAAGVEAQAEPGGSHEMTTARSPEKCPSNKGDSSFPR